MSKQLSEPTKWSGFAPTAHTLNDKIVWNLPVMRHAIGEGLKNELEITLGEAFSQVIPAQTLSVEHSFGTLKIKTEAGEFAYGGTRFNVDLLGAILSLHKDGFESFGSLWFWYDSDSSADEYPHNSYSFFVVSGNKIALEHVTFSEFRGNGFNPEVFVPPDYKGASWWHQPHWGEALTAYWYRRFYRETLTGQVMVLRPDKPPLHHFPEGRWQQSIAFYLVVEQLSRIQRLLLYILVALGIVILLVLLRK